MRNFAEGDQRAREGIRQMTELKLDGIGEDTGRRLSRQRKPAPVTVQRLQKSPLKMKP